MEEEMDQRVAIRQQIEKDYHNKKYAGNSTKVKYGHNLSAFNHYHSLIDSIPIGKVLDFGCGNGWVSIHLAQSGHDVTGIDISEELIKAAKTLAKEKNLTHKIRFEEMAGENLLFEQNYFDAVVGSSILHHVDLELAINSIKKILKPGGKGIFIEPLNQNIMLKIWRKSTPWRRSPVEKALTIDEINQIKDRFPCLKPNYYYLTSMVTMGLSVVFPSVGFFRKLNSKFEDFDEFIVKTFPSFGISCAVVVLEFIKEEGCSYRSGF